MFPLKVSFQILKDSLLKSHLFTNFDCSLSVSCQIFRAYQQMVTGSTPKSCNQGQEKKSEKSSSKARDEMPSVCTSTNETTSGEVSCACLYTVHTSGAGGEWFFLWMDLACNLRLLH